METEWAFRQNTTSLNVHLSALSEEVQKIHLKVVQSLNHYRCLSKSEMIGLKKRLCYCLYQWLFVPLFFFKKKRKTVNFTKLSRFQLFSKETIPVSFPSRSMTALMPRNSWFASKWFTTSCELTCIRSFAWMSASMSC